MREDGAVVTVPRSGIRRTGRGIFGHAALPLPPPSPIPPVGNLMGCDGSCVVVFRICGCGHVFCVCDSECVSCTVTGGVLVYIIALALCECLRAHACARRLPLLALLTSSCRSWSS